MQRSVLALSVMALTISATAHAEPINIYQTSQGVPVRQVAAQGSYGGGFIEFLFGGGSSRGSAQRYERYPSYPGDLGPGVIEAPNQPGQFIMDQRYVRQVVPYHSSEEAGTIIINTQDRMLYLVQASSRAIRYAIGVGRPGFTWSGVHHVSQKREWPTGLLPRRCSVAGPICRTT